MLVTLRLIVISISTHSLTKRLTQLRQKMKKLMLHFNSQPHEEADLTHGRKIFHKSNFNSQPHEEADYHSPQSSHLPEYFNSQPHEEADHGETVEPPGKQYFNSQPHEEADGRPARIQSRHQDISTHSLTKRLTINSFQLQNHFFISTHSLTKRLTRLLFLPLLRLRYFNSQPHEEADNTPF